MPSLSLSGRLSTPIRSLDPESVPSAINTLLPPDMPAEVRISDLEVELRNNHPMLTAYAIHDMARAIYRKQLEESAIKAMQDVFRSDAAAAAAAAAAKAEQGSGIHFEEDGIDENLVDDSGNEILGYDDDGCAIVGYENGNPIICDEDGWKCIKTEAGLFYPSGCKDDGTIDSWSFSPGHGYLAIPQTLKENYSLAYPLDVLPDAGMSLYPQMLRPDIVDQLEQENSTVPAEVSDELAEPVTPGNEDQNDAEYVENHQAEFLPNLDVKPLADFRDEVAFPTVARLPHYNDNHRSAPYIVDDVYERHWCLLAEIIFVSDVEPHLTAIDRAGQIFRVWMAFLELDEWVDELICVGNTIAIMYAESYEWSREPGRWGAKTRYVRAAKRDEIAILPLSIEKLTKLSDKVQKTVKPGEGLVCGGCGHVRLPTKMEKCDDCKFENFCNSICRGYSILKGHKKDCGNMALMSGFFRLDWGRYRYHARFPL